MLHKLRWELSSTVALDYLDHILPRLPGLPLHLDLARLRMKTETIIALAATHTQFLAVYPSLLAASSILTALLSVNLEAASGGQHHIASATSGTLETLLGWQPPLTPAVAETAVAVVSETLMREVRLCLQILTHAGSAELDLVCGQMRDSLPAYLTGQHVATSSAAAAAPVSPDTTLCPPSPSLYPANHHAEERPGSACSANLYSEQPPSSSSSSAFPFNPFHSTAADVFSDLKSAVLEAAGEASQPASASSNDPLISNSILVT